MMTESCKKSHKNPAMFLPLDFAPILLTHPFLKASGGREFETGHQRQRGAGPDFYLRKMAEIRRFRLFFFFERFFLVNMSCDSFGARSIVCNTYRCTMLKTLLHWLHSKGKAAVFVLGVCVGVFLVRRI